MSSYYIDIVNIALV